MKYTNYKYEIVLFHHATEDGQMETLVMAGEGGTWVMIAIRPGLRVPVSVNDRQLTFYGDNKVTDRPNFSKEFVEKVKRLL